MLLLSEQCPTLCTASHGHAAANITAVRLETTIRGVQDLPGEALPPGIQTQ